MLRCPELVEGAAAAVKCEGVYSRLAATPGAIEEEQDCSERRRMSLYDRLFKGAVMSDTTFKLKLFSLEGALDAKAKPTY